MKNIKAVLCTIIIIALPMSMNAQITDFLVNQIVDQIVGSIIDGIAESAGREAGDNATRSFTESFGKNSNNKGVTNYNKAKENVIINSSKNAFGALSPKGSVNGYSVTSAKNDVEGIYCGMNIDENIVKVIREMYSINHQTIDTLLEESKNPEFYLETMRIDDVLSQRTYSLWIQSEHTSNDNNTLLGDVSRNIQLLSLFNTIPQSISTYQKICRSDFREDVDLIYYLTCTANRYGYFVDYIGCFDGYINPRTFFIQGSSAESVVLDSIGANLGTISKKRDKKFVITCHGTTMLNLFPIKNSSYILNNNLWETDAFGRPITVSSTFNEKVVKSKQDKKIDSFVKTAKTHYNVLGKGRVINLKKMESFYLVPTSLGGEPCLINIIPLEKQNANYKELKKIDKAIAKAAKKGKLCSRKIFLKYQDNLSFIPSEIKVEVIIDSEPYTYTIR